MASVLDIKINSAERPTSVDASLDPYARLLKMLMPSLRGVVVHDGFSNLVWASEEQNLADEPQIIADTIANALSDTAEYAGICRTLDADSVVYSFAVRGEHIELLGVVSLIVRLSGTQIEPRPLQTVRNLVQPALECLRREMALRLQLGSRERDLTCASATLIWCWTSPPSRPRPPVMLTSSRSSCAPASSAWAAPWRRCGCRTRTSACH